MAKRINVKLILELSAGGLTQNEIAVSRYFSKTSVSLVLKTARELNVSAEELREMTPDEAYRLFLPEKLSADQIYELPDYEYVHEELKKVGVTLKLLWEEYPAFTLQLSGIPSFFAADSRHISLHQALPRSCKRGSFLCSLYPMEQAWISNNDTRTTPAFRIC